MNNSNIPPHEKRPVVEDGEERSSLEGSLAELQTFHSEQVKHERELRAIELSKKELRRISALKKKRHHTIKEMYSALQIRREEKVKNRIAAAKMFSHQAAREILRPLQEQADGQLRILKQEQQLERDLLVLQQRSIKKKLTRMLRTSACAVALAALLAVGFVQNNAAAHANELSAMKEGVASLDSSQKTVLDELKKQVNSSMNTIEAERRYLEAELAAAQETLSLTIEEIELPVQTSVRVATQKQPRSVIHSVHPQSDKSSQKVSGSLNHESDPFLMTECSPGDPLCGTL